jgi:arginyl-tRNA synthetase
LPLQEIKDDIGRALARLLQERFAIVPERIAVEYPPQTGMGDLALPIAFELARRLRKAPRLIAQDLAAAFPPVEGVARVEAAGAGYLNVFLDRRALVRRLEQELSAAPSPILPGKILVEHTNINPNKAAHIGHLRNAVLGDTLARALRFLGHRVEVQNYIDNTGVQVADLVIGFRDLLHLGVEGARAVTGRFDHFCWDLYARVTQMYERDAATLELRPPVLKQLEEAEGEIGELAAFVTHRIVHCHLDTMERIGVRYDLLPWEGDVLAYRFWETAFALLQERRAITRVATGERAGCWVMALEGPRFENLKEGEKIIVRSNGTVTYVGKDIAYQLWKFGLLPVDFRYEPFRDQPGGHRVWSSTRAAGEAVHPSFGGATRVYNVIDTRQAYLQAIVVEGLRALGHRTAADQSIHFSYEMVALTPRSAATLGVALSEEDRGRPYLEMSGRRGLGVKADDLLDALERQARREVDSRHAGLPTAEAEELARAIAVGALRYFMLKYARNTVLAFDFDEALSFEGETGPYLQYAVVRAGAIFDRMAAAGGPDASVAASWARDGEFDLPPGEAEEEHWALLLQIARLRETVAQAIDALELSQIAKYTFALAQRFNSFYHKYPVMKETDERWRRARVVLTHLFHAQMTRALDLMGIAAPSRM